MTSETLKIIKAAEGQGLGFIVHRGAVFNRTIADVDLLTQTLLLVEREEIREYLLATRGADPDPLIGLWESDPEIQERFRSLPELDDFAHKEGLRLLRSAFPEMAIDDSSR